MINISFVNPYLLLLFIPLAALVIVPYCIAISKENKSKASTVGLILHLVMILIAVLAIAGMSNVAVITETEVYVLADVSASVADKIDVVDDYIETVEKNLPANSKMGVITFGKNYRIHTPLGGEVTSVANNKVNDSATDIIAVLKYTETLFSDNAIKRIVIISDGMSTDPDATGELVRIIEDLKAKGVYIDVMYVDSNLTDDIKEVQVSSVDYSANAYLERNSMADVLLESTYDTDAIATLMKNGQPYLDKAVKLTKGYNIINFNLDTSTPGDHDYTVTFKVVDDTLDKNNTISFTQQVTEIMRVLLITSSTADRDAALRLYGDFAIIDSYVKPADPTPTISNPNPKPVTFDVPYTVEDLCIYDEILIYNVDIRKINNTDTFIKSLDTVVSMFGKSLITVGNNHIQNEDDASLDALEDMLPVKFGNNDADPKLYTLVIDSSRSMEFLNADFFVMAKLSASYLLGMLDENDYFAIIHFSGEVYHLSQPRQATAKNITEALTEVNNLEVTQGTMIGAALEAARDMMIPLSFSEKQIMLISDGMSFEGGEVLEDDPIEVAKTLADNNITVSTLNTGNKDTAGINTMKAIAQTAGGKYYFCERSSDLAGLMFNEIAGDVNETEVIGRAEVVIKKENDKMLEGVEEIAPINGYVYSGTKASAETVLCVNYTKASGGVVEVPLYAYWSYGSGRVATLTTDLLGSWSGSWNNTDGINLLANLLKSNIPEQRIDYPYTVNVEYDGKYSHIEIIPAVLNPDAIMSVKVILPDGSETGEKLTFNSYRYFYKVETGLVGKYRIQTTYQFATKSYSSETVYTVCYSPEYDRFATYSPAQIYTFMRNNGNVSENGTVDLKPDESKIATYVLSFKVPFLAIVAALYVIDTIIRKLKWADIKSFFKKGTKEVKK